MKIALHIGVHRTGTTALQAALDLGSAQLRADGVWFAQLPVVRPAVSSRLIAAERGGRWSRARARRAIRAFARAREDEGIDRLVISDELILGLMDRSLGPAGVYPSAGARLGLLAEALEGWPVRAYAALRPPASWLPSVYAFALSRRPQRPWAEARAGALEAERGFAALARDVAEVFPDPLFWTTEFYRAHPWRVHARLTERGFARRFGKPRKAVNGSLSGPAMARLEALRARGARIDRETLRALRREAPVHLRGAWDPWSAEERAALDARWRADIAPKSGVSSSGNGTDNSLKRCCSWELSLLVWQLWGYSMSNAWRRGFRRSANCYLRCFRQILAAFPNGLCRLSIPWP
ncbi:MAG: hypothetical protein AAGI51_10255 [Pseudomonadota bacterium]